MERRKKTFVAIDIETSGPNPFLHQPLAIALIAFSDRASNLQVFIKHEEVAWSTRARQMFHSYQRDWELHAVDAKVACRRIRKFLEGLDAQEIVLVGHNVAFDLAFLRKLFFLAGKKTIETLSHRSLDTHTLMYALARLGRVPETSLSSSRAFYQLEVRPSVAERHTAFGDAKAVLELSEKIFSILDECGSRLRPRS